MSRKDVKAVVRRMLTDEEFRLALFEDPEGAIRGGGFDVSEEELEGFKAIEEEDLANLSPEELEGRLSKDTFTVIACINSKAAD